MAENLVKFGLKNVHIAPITKIDLTATEEDKVYTYDAPFAYPGAVNFTANSKSKSDPFYADDRDYKDIYSNSGYDVTFESARMVDKFVEKILNEKDGRERESDKPVAFAIMGEIDGDVKKRRFIFWNCNITKRPDFAAQTKQESATPQTDSWTCTASARADTGDIKATAYEDWNVYSTMFTAVPKPSEFKKPTTVASGS